MNEHLHSKESSGKRGVGTMGRWSDFRLLFFLALENAHDPQPFAGRSQPTAGSVSTDTPRDEKLK
jgi:hypothetical protein